MAHKSNVTLPNFVGGELSPFMSGRVDLELFAKSLEWCKNFLVLPQGGSSYRPGNYLCGLTKDNTAAGLIPFQFSANDSYMIVATDNKFRFYRNNGVILNTAKNITAITKANPAVVTSTSHGFSTGDEIFITNVEGMAQINNRFFKVVSTGANTFSLKDQFGVDVDSQQYDTYDSGGTAASIFELATPYLAEDLSELRHAQTADLMYLSSREYTPRKLTRTGHTSWTLAKYSRTNDPFTYDERAISAMTIAAEAVFTTSVNHGFVVGDRVFVEGTGTAQVQNKFLRIKTTPAANTFSAYYDDGVTVVNSTGWTHSNGNTAAKLNKCPACPAFSSDARLYFVNTQDNPEGVWGSRAPSGTTNRFDDFTTGSNATDAVIFPLAPVEGIIDSIQEIKQFEKNFVLLGTSSIRRVYGSSEDQPPTPTAINTRATIEGSAKVKPVVVGGTMLFVDVSGKTLKGLRFNFAKDDYEAEDFNLVADHLGVVAFKKIIRVKGNPDTVWVLRNDGMLLSFAFNSKENLSGWARHDVGASGVVEDIATIRRDTGEDQLWMIVKRSMGGKTYRSVEVMSAWPVFPQKRAFFTGKDNKEADKAKYENAMWEQLKSPTFLDMSLTFDGTARGIAKNATLTPSATTGTGITISSNNAVFRTDHIGRKIWKRYDSTGGGGGQAIITGYISSTQVICNVESAFDSTAAIAPGSWEFAVNEVKNLQLYEGLTVDLQVDGSAHPSQLVASGKITLQQHASRIHAGFIYKAMLATQNIDIGGRSGPANSKPRNIKRVSMRFKDSNGAQVGPSEYANQEIIYRGPGQIMGRVPPPFSGVKELRQIDTWGNDSKQIVVIHDQPTPLTVVAMDVEVYTVDED